MSCQSKEPPPFLNNCPPPLVQTHTFYKKNFIPILIAKLEEVNSPFVKGGFKLCSSMFDEIESNTVHKDKEGD